MLEFTQDTSSRMAMPKRVLAARHRKKPDLRPEYCKLPNNFGLNIPAPLKTGL